MVNHAHVNPDLTFNKIMEINDIESSQMYDWFYRHSIQDIQFAKSVKPAGHFFAQIRSEFIT